MYGQPQPAMPSQPQLQPQPQSQPQPGQPGVQQQQPGQPPMHGGAPSNPFPTGPSQPTVSIGKMPPFAPSKAPGSAKTTHRTVPGGPGTAGGVKKEGTSPNLEAKDAKDGVKRSPASRPASQASKPGAGAATPSANAGLQPSGSVGGVGTLSPGSLITAQQQQQRQTQVQATLNQSPSLLSVGVSAPGMLNGLGAGAGSMGSPSGATTNPAAALPSADLFFNHDFNPSANMDIFNDPFPFGIPGFGSGMDDSLTFLNMNMSGDGYE